MLLFGVGTFSQETQRLIVEDGNSLLEPPKNLLEFLDRERADRQLEQVMARCDGVLLAPDWEHYALADTVEDLSEALQLPIYHDIPYPHPTEVKCPIQAVSFLQEVMEMYRLHLDKNHDYSPANILGTGDIGVVTRLWDKMARLMSLMGIQIEVKFLGYQEPKEPKNESIDDTARDLANYAIIFGLNRRGQWGR